MIARMSINKEEAAAFPRDGLADDDAHALREQLSQATPRRLSENGFRLYIHYGFDGDAAGVRFATMTEMAAELACGAEKRPRGRRPGERRRLVSATERKRLEKERSSPTTAFRATLRAAGLPRSATACWSSISSSGPRRTSCVLF